MLDKIGKILSTRGGLVAFSALIILAINLIFDQGSYRSPYSIVIWLVAGIVLGLMMDARRKNSPAYAVWQRNTTTTLRSFNKMINHEVIPNGQENKDEYFEYICRLQKTYEKRSLRSDLMAFGFITLILLLGVAGNHGLSPIYDLGLLCMAYFAYSSFHVRLTLKRIYRIKEKFYGVKRPLPPQATIET